jgi:hypothetical protein
MALPTRLVFPKKPKSLAMPPQQRLWLNDEQRLFPGPYCSCQHHQEHSIRPGACGSFDVSAEDNQLLAQERVFCHEFRLASGKVCQDPHHERGGGVRFGPVSEAVEERLKAKACKPFDEGKNSVQSVYYPF